MGLRILCVTPWFPNFPTDGKYNFIFRSVRALADTGNEVTVLVTRPWIPRRLAARNLEWAHTRAPIERESFGSGIHIDVIRYPSLPRYVLSRVVDALYRRRIGGRIRRLIKERKVQLVHAHTEGAGSAAVEVAWTCQVPAVITLHGISTAPQLLNSAAKRERLRRTLAVADRVILVGEPLRSYFAPLGGGDENFRIVPNGFFLPESTERSDADSRRDVLRFISVSNLDEGKGIDLNLRALARLRSVGHDNWVYSVVGEGTERAELEAMTDGLGLRDKVTFHGALPHDRALQQLADADVFVLPSYREAFGVAYLEAMASGLFTIGVSGQGPEAFITSGETGMLVKPNDVDSLFDAMRMPIENRPKTQRVAAAGKRFVRSEFTWAEHAEKLMVVYREALTT